MSYQEILKAKLAFRMRINSRYSMRAFAQFLRLSPSKLSEILTGKRGLSLEKAKVVCQRLNLPYHERQGFLLSVQAQHARAKKMRELAQIQLKELQSTQGQEKVKTRQKNAWYFGAYRAIAGSNMAAKADPIRIAKQLNLNPLQIENAERFHSRIRKLHPDKQELSYEPMSLLKKLNDDFATQAQMSLDAEFVFLLEEEVQKLVSLIKQKVKEFAQEREFSESKSLFMLTLTMTEQLRMEELC